MQTETTKTMGSLLPGIVDQSIAGTVSCGPLTQASQVLDLATLPRRLDDQTLDLLREVMISPLPEPARCDDEHFAKCLRSMAILPYRADDATGGALRHRLYAAKLQGFSNEAMGYLVSKALEQCQWFPTIAECLRILATWPNRDVASARRGKAEVLVRDEMQARMNEALETLRRREIDQSEIDALPDLWKRVAAENCLLWAWPDGRFTARRDTEAMSEDERIAYRAEVAAMQAEWETIKADLASESEASDV